MSPKEYVAKGLKINSNTSLAHYTIPKPANMDSLLVKRIVKGKKTTFIDEAVKRSKMTPAFTYNLATDLKNKRTQSNMCKAKRNFQSDDIQAFQNKYKFPAPVAYNPAKEFVMRKHNTSYN
jgi:hypothetical protein